MPKRILEGRVVSDKANKTISVLVERRTMHPIYKKYVKSSKKFAAHDDANMFIIGDVVRIEECAPISKSKTWTVISPAPEGRTPRSFKVTEVTKPVAKVKEAKVATPKKASATSTQPKAEKPAAAKKLAAKKTTTKAKTEE